MNNSSTVLSRKELVDLLVSNLVVLRAKAKLKQSELAGSIGMSRLTLSSIENNKTKMRWDTFLALCLIFCDNPKTSEYMKFLGLHYDSISPNILNGGGYNMGFEKIWTDYETNYTEIKAICALPAGLKDLVCPNCGSKDLVGALITPTADDQDPNILCKNCGYWRD